MLDGQRVSMSETLPGGQIFSTGAPAVHDNPQLQEVTTIIIPSFSKSTPITRSQASPQLSLSIEGTRISSFHGITPIPEDLSR
jgi:hypothetical protein